MTAAAWFTWSRATSMRVKGSATMRFLSLTATSSSAVFSTGEAE